MNWYLRSIGDRDTHRGQLRPDGTVTAACEIKFAPLHPLRDRSPTLPGQPPEAAQVCPACCRVMPGDAELRG
jgi:hypothetical protein